MRNIEAASPASVSKLYQQQLPASQESFVSAASSTFSAPALPSNSSNVSTSTVAETELTSPSLPSSQDKPARRAAPQSPPQARGCHVQANAPRIDTSTANANALRTGNTAAIPMAVDSPATQGFKRAADGSFKGSEGSMASPHVSSSMGHKRNKSMDTRPNPRIEKLSAQLKTRLSYAMVKVQNGWEKQSLEELEERSSQQGSPGSAPGRSDGSRPTFHSPSTAERRRRPSGVSENSDLMMMSPGPSTPSDASRSLAATPSTMWRPGTKPTMNATANLMSVTGSNVSTGLAPAPDLSARRKRRSSASHPPPPLLSTTQRKYCSDLGPAASPQTPVTPRAGILRMPSQQAEKDAVDTLLFMSSPNNSGRVPHTNQAQPGPLRPEAPRRVMFDTHPHQDNGAASQRPMHPPSSQPAAHYQVHQPR